MPTRDMKTRFTLEGEQQFKTAMKEAANSVKVLNSQEKLAKAQFKQTGDAQKLQAAQTDILKKKIAEQQKAVKAAEDAMKQLAKNGVSENSKQMQDWQVKLNNAKTALTGMETELQNLENGTEQAAGATGDLNKELGQIDKKLSIDAVIKGIDRITGALTSAVSKVKELGTGLYDAMRDAGGWADDLATQALVYSLTPQELQQMQYAANLIDTNVETIITARSKLGRSMKSDSKETKKYFKDLGVQVMAAGVYRDWADVLWDVGDALMAMPEGKWAEREAAAQALLGKSWNELLPMFTAGRKEYERVMNEAPTVSDEDIGKLTEMDDAFNKLTAQMDVTKRTILAQLAPAFTELANTVGEVMKKVNEYLQSEEGKKKLEELSNAVKALFEGLGEIDFGALLDAAKDALDKLNSSLAWIKDNKDLIVNAIKGIAAAFGLMKVSQGVLTALQLMNGLKGLHIGGGGGNGSGGGSGTTGGNATGGGGALTGLITTIKTGFKNAVTAAAPIVGGPLAFLGLSGAAGAVLSTKAVDRDYGAYNKTVEKLDELTAPTDSMSEAVTGLQQSLIEAQAAVERFSSAENEDGTQPLRDYIAQNVEGVRAATEGAGIWNRLDDAAKNAGKTVSQIVEDGSITATAEEWLLLLTQYIADMGEKVEDAKTKGTEIGQGTADGMTESLPAVESAGTEVGTQAAAGVEAGIAAGTGGVVAAAQRLAGAAVGAMRNVLMIRSPSKVMAELGGYVTEGFAEGITGGLGLVNQAAAAMAGAVTAAPRVPGMRAGVAGAAADGSIDGRMVDITLMLGPERLAEVLVPLVDNGLGEIINLDRR